MLSNEITIKNGMVRSKTIDNTGNDYSQAHLDSLKRQLQQAIQTGDREWAKELEETIYEIETYIQSMNKNS